MTAGNFFIEKRTKKRPQSLCDLTEMRICL